jgi:hypothetical protein
MTRTVRARCDEVLDALLVTAAELGYEAPLRERRPGEIRLKGPMNRVGDSPRLTVSITDNGFGGSTVLVSWEDRFPRRYTGHRVASRLCKGTQRLLA